MIFLLILGVKQNAKKRKVAKRDLSEFGRTTASNIPEECILVDLQYDEFLCFGNDKYWALLFGRFWSLARLLRTVFVQFSKIIYVNHIYYRHKINVV